MENIKYTVLIDLDGVLNEYKGDYILNNHKKKLCTSGA